MRRLLHENLLISIILFIGISQVTQAQVAKSFWFVAPEVTNGHNDDEAVLRLTALDQPATVTISLPANPSFTPITRTIPAGQQEKVELNAFLSLIENGTMGNSPQPSINDWNGWTKGKAFNKGMLIESTTNITVYYEIANKFNPDRFTLKGDNALGKEFYIPSQNTFKNRELTPLAREKVDIVATEDNTKITFTLTDDVNFHNGLEGHKKGVEYTILLDRGESYCLRRTDGSASRHLGGSHITSDKPIAITISDDSLMDTEGTNYDLVGDQIVPVNVTGKEFVVVNTMFEINRPGLPNNGQKVFLTATEDNTEIKFNNDNTTVVTLNAGEMWGYDITQDFEYIKSNHNIYVYQFSSVKHELGSALVPATNCTGSTSVSISRIYAGMFSVQIMTQKRNLANFNMTNSSNQPTTNLLPRSDQWHRIEGSAVEGNDDYTWYAAVVDMEATTGEVYTITNTGLFHLSVLDANGSSMSYGYFSAFNNLRIDGPTMSCVGEEIVLRSYKDPKTLTWFYRDGLGDQEVIGTGVDSIIAEREGEYWIEQKYPGCLDTDKINVKYNRPVFTLGGDREVCYKKDDPTITVIAETTPPDADYTYQWGNPFQDYTTNTLTFTPNPGEIYNLSLTATTTDDLKCMFTDTVEIVVKSIPSVTWNLTENQKDICLGDYIMLENIQNDFTYQWYLDGVKIDGATEPIYQPAVSGLYEVDVTTSRNCTVTEARPITVNQNPSVNIHDIAECPGDPGLFSLSGYSSYEWYDATKPTTILGSNPTLSLDTPMSELVVKISNEFGCFATDTAEFKWHNENVFSFGTDTTLCEGMNMSIEIDAHFIDYKWKFNNVDIPTSGSNPTANDHLLEFSAVDYTVSGVYSITAEDNINHCPVTGEFNLEVLPPVWFTLEYDDKNGKICEGDSIKLVPQDDNGRDFTTFNWFKENPTTSNWEEVPTDDGGGMEYLIVKDEGNFKLEALQDNKCMFESDPLSVSVLEAPSFYFEGGEFCLGDDLTLKIEDYRNMSGDPDGEFSHAIWWNFSGGANENDPTPLPYTKVVEEEGNHTVTVYDQLGCFMTRQTYVGYYETPNITLENASFCDGEGYDLTLSTTALNIKDYFWSKEGTVISETITYEGGEYTLTVTTLDDCEVVIGTIELTALPSPQPTLPLLSEICEGETISIETEGSYKSYQWFREGVAIDGETTASIVPTINGEYSVLVVGKNECEETVSTQVIIRDNPIVDLGPDQDVCPGETISITIGNYDRIVWSTGEVDIKTVTLSSGSHSVLVKDEKGCIGTDEVKVSSYPVPKFSLGEDEIVCPNELPRYIQEPAGYQEYVWHSGAVREGSDRIQGNIMDTVNILKAKDLNGCWAMDTKVINLRPEPDYRFGNDINDCDTDIELTAGSFFSLETSDGIEETAVLTYHWEHNNATEPTIMVNESKQFIVRAFDGCWYKTDTFNVKLHPNPVITGLDTLIYARVTVLTDPDLGTQPFTYTLNNSNPQNDKTFKEVENGEHTVWVEDAYGCTDFRVFQFNSSIDDLEIPNFFTPNGDGINDRWIIRGLEKVPETEIRVYDRHGKLLKRYLASDEPWDGTYLNRPLPSDDYWYVILLKPIDKIVKGNVTIKR